MEGKNVQSLLLDGSEFDSGELEFAVRDGVTVKFNPTDPLMIGRLYNATQALASRQEEYKRKAAAMADDSPELLDFMSTINEEMKDTISSVFLHGAPDVFCGVGAYAYNRSGIPLWVAFITAVMDRMDVSVKTAQSEQSAKLEKLLSKYKRK